MKKLASYNQKDIEHSILDFWNKNDIFEKSLEKTKAGEKFKSAAQGLITLATYGGGMLIGFWVAGLITDAYKISEFKHDWEKIWMIASFISALVAVLFFFTFNQKLENSERNMDKKLNEI